MRADDGDFRGVQPLLLYPIQLPDPRHHHVCLGHRREPGHALCHRLPAAPHGDGQAHAVDEAGRGRLRRVELPVGVEPDDTQTFWAGARDSPDGGGVAVAGEHQREPALDDGLTHLARNQSVQLEGGRHLGRGLYLVSHVGDARPPALRSHRFSEAVVNKVLRACAHPQTRVPRVVGHGDDSDVSVMFHAGLQFSAGRLDCAAKIGRPAFPGRSITRLLRLLGSFHPAESTLRYPSNSFHSPSAVSGTALNSDRDCFSTWAAKSLGPSWRGFLPVPRSTFPNVRDDEAVTNARPNSSTTLGGVPAGAAIPPKTGTLTS